MEAGRLADDALPHEVTSSDVPDVLAPGLRVVFCGINPGRVSAAAHAHFANPRNDFWRLLHAAGFTPRLFEPAEQEALLELGVGLTNASYRTTPGSGDLRTADFAGSEERLERLAVSLDPRAIAFVGKEAYRGVFRERPELGAQLRTLDDTGLFVLPSTSPANAAVPWEERLRWFRGLAHWLDGVPRTAARALVLDADDRVLLVRFVNPATGLTFWATTGGGVDPGETHEQTLDRELAEEAGLRDYELGPEVWVRVHTFPWDRTIITQQERYRLVRVHAHEPAPELDLLAEGVHEVRWWTTDELRTATERFSPRRLPELVLRLLRDGPPAKPLDVGV
jgi:TDG/mug DNA glycosylase family protein